jgi:RNA polymerase sigma-70 factor (ECF subfamily)
MVDARTSRAFELCIAGFQKEKMNKEAFEQLINDHSTLVLNTARRILGCPQKAGDVHQEVFMAIWQRLDTYNGEINWPGYLYRTTIRKAIELTKNIKPQTLNDENSVSITKQAPDWPMRGEEMQQKLAGALAKLPKQQAEVFVLSRIEGLDRKEIAQMLNCSPNTVGVHLHRAVKKLAQTFTRYLDR